MQWFSVQNLINILHLTCTCFLLLKYQWSQKLITNRIQSIFSINVNNETSSNNLLSSDSDLKSESAILSKRAPKIASVMENINFTYVLKNEVISEVINLEVLLTNHSECSWMCVSCNLILVFNFDIFDILRWNCTILSLVILLIKLLIQLTNIWHNSDSVSIKIKLPDSILSSVFNEILHLLLSLSFSHDLK